MARPKDPEKKDKIQVVREKLAQEHEKRVAAERPVEMEESEVREAFRVFWASKKRVYNKTRDLEEVLWAHLKAIKHNRPDLFEKGCEHFGLKK